MGYDDAYGIGKQSAAVGVVDNGIDSVAGEFAGEVSGSGEAGAALYDVGAGIVDLSDAATDVVAAL
ncbi:MAG: hypothetical protein M1491_01400 [Deltaproteobacteria bacterium]|nr:hypothetical protein [Deltaproteobacteria bacterium]MCL5277638.1 hypothetical protein [Deltaproteobacteria bacterium]